MCVCTDRTINLKKAEYSPSKPICGQMKQFEKVNFESPEFLHEKEFKISINQLNINTI